MKTKWMATVVALALVVTLSQTLWAQPPRQGRGPQAGQAQPRRGMGGGMFGGLDLTEEQQQKIDQIRQKFMGKIRAAETPEARREVFGQMREAISQVLTEEQRAQLRQRFGQFQRPGQQPRQRPAERPAEGPQFSMDLLRRMNEQLDLTPEQRQRIAQMVRQAMQRLMADIRQNVLTEEQRKKLAELRPERPARPEQPGQPGGPSTGRGRMFGGMFDQLGLSEEQQQKMAAIRDKYMEKMRTADRDQRRGIFEKMRDEMNAVLTEEQRQKMEELRQRFGGGFRGRSGAQGGGPRRGQ